MTRKNKCNVCGKETVLLFNKKILNKYFVDYLKCKRCGIIQTEKPYWLKEAYESPIFNADTGLLSRNIILSKIVSSLIYFLFDRKGKHLDYAGGYGVFTRLMRDIGLDYYWDDPFSKNLFAEGFKFTSGVKYQVVTAFEYFEHINNPLKEVSDIFKKFNCEALIFSTTLYPNKLDDNWWYFMYESGQHVSFYKKETLEYIASKLHLNYLTNGKNFHMLTKDKLSLWKFILLTYGFYITNMFPLFLLKSKTVEDHEKIKKYEQQ